jgi:hypothetical protein
MLGDKNLVSTWTDTAEVSHRPKESEGWVQWLTPIIPATLEVEIERIMV